jgi:membrane protein DedA with SNARE-associated domain/rhodanese-related sulfurtransferase
MDFLMRHGYAALFVCVLAEQLGVPVPAVPLLLAAGALAGLGQLNLGIALAVAVAAALIGDTVWYWLGKTRGMAVLRVLCHISLEPEGCVRKTNFAYAKHGARWLLFAKFIPGVSTIAPPMAGIYRVSAGRFLAMDGAGAALWAGTFLGAGWCFRGQIDAIAGVMSQVGGGLIVGAAGVVGILVLTARIRRSRLHRSLRGTRIAPLELKERMEGGERFTILDLRNGFEWREGRIPGSRVMADAELEAFVATAGEAEVVLYCSCPDEIASIAGAAVRLRRRGVKVIRPLEGGFPRWTELGFPVEAA